MPPFLVGYKTSKGENEFIRCLFGFMAAIVGSINPNIRGHRCASHRKPAEQLVFDRLFCFFFGGAKKKRKKKHSTVVSVFTNNILELPFLVGHKTNKGENEFIRSLFGFMAAIIGSINPNIRGSRYASHRKAAEQLVFDRLFCFFFGGAKKKRKKKHSTLLVFSPTIYLRSHFLLVIRPTRAKIKIFSLTK